MRGRASGRARTDHVEFALGSDKTTIRIGLIESCFSDRWYLVVGCQSRKSTDVDGASVDAWRAIDHMIRHYLPHPFDRSDFCQKLLAVFAHIRDYGPATPLTELVWAAYGDLIDTIAAG